MAVGNGSLEYWIKLISASAKEATPTRAEKMVRKLESIAKADYSA